MSEPGRTVRIEADQGRDPLVVDWIRQRRADCAWQSFSPSNVVTGFVGSLMAGAVYHGWMVPSGIESDLPPFVLAWLYEPTLFCTGMAIYLTLALVWQQLLKPSKISAGPEQCAGVALAAIVYLLVWDLLIAISLITAVICVSYITVCGMRIAAVLGARVPPIEADVTRPTGLPVYTVLVPLYKEANIAGQILINMGNLDYPSDRLDVKFLLEADDDETVAAFEAHELPGWAEVVVVPHTQPKTKPRACNHGLARARGEFLVIYDAEDRPEPDQLRKAVAAFDRLPEEVACVQAHLAYHNHRQNLLTQLFAQEYNGWFRHYLPGLCRFGSPIPLGGTSNHFRVGPLKEAGGWDPYNVTEDCDLGLRLAVSGKRAAILPSTTWEEANSRVGNWIRQRSRWIKGYMQTFLVWARRPGRLLTRLGPWKTLWFMTTVGSVAVFSVLNPILWLVLAIYCVALVHDLSLGYELWHLLAVRDNSPVLWSWPMIYSGKGEDPLWMSLSIVFFIFSIALLVFNLVFAWLHVRCGQRPGQHFDRVKTFCVLPWYWALMSIAGWKAAWQLVVKPHYWEKTVHGLDEVGKKKK